MKPEDRWTWGYRAGSQDRLVHALRPDPAGPRSTFCGRPADRIRLELAPSPDALCRRCLESLPAPMTDAAAREIAMAELRRPR